MTNKAIIVVLGSAALGVTLGLAVKASLLQTPMPGGSAAAIGERTARDPFPANMPRQARKQMAQLERMNTYRGTSISAANFKPAIARTITEAFARLDPKPPIRQAHFQWALTDPDLNVVGWTGFISRMEAAPGGWLVEVHVFPRFEQPSGIVTTKDRCVERWLYKDGTLEFIPVEHAHAGGGVGSLFID